MRQRIEDLGRLAEKLNVILDHDLFDRVDRHEDHFFSYYRHSEDHVEELYHQLSYIKSVLVDCYEIAREGDGEVGEYLEQLIRKMRDV